MAPDAPIWQIGLVAFLSTLAASALQWLYSFPRIRPFVQWAVWSAIDWLILGIAFMLYRGTSLNLDDIYNVFWLTIPAGAIGIAHVAIICSAQRFKAQRQRSASLPAPKYLPAPR